jgi:hypothetical protein
LGDAKRMGQISTFWWLLHACARSAGAGIFLFPSPAARLPPVQTHPAGVSDGESDAWRTPVQTDTHGREQQMGHVRALSAASFSPLPLHTHARRGERDIHMHVNQAA